MSLLDVFLSRGSVAGFCAIGRSSLTGAEDMLEAPGDAKTKEAPMSQKETRGPLSFLHCSGIELV